MPQRAAADIAGGVAAVSSPLWLTDVLSTATDALTLLTALGGAVLVWVRVYYVIKKRGKEPIL